MIQKTQIKINNTNHNLSIYTERRNSIRASITKTGINIRIPRHLNKYDRDIQRRKFLEWAVKKIKEKPQVSKKPKTYTHKDFLRTHSKVYQLQIEHRDSQKNFSKISGSHIIFKISNKYDEQKKQEYISKQLKKLLAKNHLKELEYHVNNLNQIHINKPIKKISYKYTISRWGSCNHTDKEINLSTRLLLAPRQILEYVIIHELAHLIEPNHSRRFWNIVKSIDPNYKAKKKWLNDHGETLNI